MKPPAQTELPPSHLLQLDVTRWRAFPVNILLFIGDWYSFSFALWLAASVISRLFPSLRDGLSWVAALPVFWFQLTSFLAIYSLFGLYPGFGLSAVDEMRLILKSLALGYGISGLFVHFQQSGSVFSYLILLFGWVLASLLNIIVRFFIRNLASRTKWWRKPVVIVGPVSQVQEAIAKLERNRQLGLSPALIFDPNYTPAGETQKQIPVLKSTIDLLQVANRHGIRDAVFVETQDTRLAYEHPSFLRWLSNQFSTVLWVPANQPPGSLWGKVLDLDGRLGIQMHYNLLDWRATCLKRTFDIGLGLLLGILSAPLLIIIALIIKLDSPGTVLYSQDRVGLHKKRFRYLKFRTMIQSADQQLDSIFERDPHAWDEYRQHHKLLNDPRVTYVGRWLRRFSLDELPQLWHVIKGEMSLVGPRAYLASEFDQMGSYADLLFQIRPGMTGWWQVTGRHSNTFTHRLQLDEYYLSNWSLWLDIYILIKTIWVWFSNPGV